MTCTKCGCNPTYAQVSGTLCRPCYVADRREKRIARKAAGARTFYESAEYRRIQREREVAREGRILCDYVPRDVRARLAAARSAVRISEDTAKRVRKRFVRSMLKEFNRIASTAFHEVVSALRKEQAAKARRDYQRNLAQERLRTAKYKAAHPETVSCYHETRQARIDATCDGSATKESIQKAKAAASRCAYCDCPFEDALKQTDHMVALCHGGEHSLRNIVIVCRPCNARKASLTYEQWIERVEPRHKVRVHRLWLKRYPALNLDLIAGALGAHWSGAGLTSQPGA